MYWHIDTDIVALIITVALYVYTVGMKPRGGSTRQDRSFQNCLLTGIIVTAVDIASSLAMDMPVSRAAYHIFMTAYLIAQNSVMVAWLIYSLTILYHDDEKRRRRATHFAAVPYAVYALLALSNPWTGVFYTLSPGMVYSRSPLFLVLLVGVFAAYSAAQLAVLFMRRRHIPDGYPTVVLVLQPLILAVSVPIQLTNPGWLLTMSAYTICLVLAFLFFQNIRVRNDEAQLRKLTELVENFACGVAIGNVSTDGRCTMYYVSRGLCEIFEQESGRLIEQYNTDILSFIHPDDRTAVKRVMDEITQTGEGGAVDFRIRTETGRLKWLNVKMSTQRQSDGALTVYTTYNDLTEQTALQRQLTELIQNVPSGICIYRWDGDDLRPISVNARFSEMLGEDALGYLQGVENFNYSHVHPDDLDKLKRDTLTALTQTHRLDTSYRSLNYRTGEYLWIHMRGKMLPQEDGTELVLVSYNDVTQEHSVQQKLMAKYVLERNRASLGEEKMIVHAVFDLTTGETLEYVRRDGSEVPEEERTAYTYGARNSHLLIDDAERARFLDLNDREKLQKRFTKGETEFRMEYRKRQPDGGVIWVRSVMHLVRDPRGSDLLLFEYWYDIDEEKMRELTYRSIASDNYDFIARIDGKTGHFISSPKEGLTGFIPPLSGDDADKVTRSIFGDSVIPEDRETVVQNMLVAVIRENLRARGRFQFTFRERGENGEQRYKKMTQYYIDAQREIIVLLCEDVTDLIREEHEKNALLSSALAAANQASEAKSKFLSRVSHELRTPLNAIIGFLSLARGADAEETERCLSNSDVAARQLLSIINDVLDVSSIESGKLKLASEPFDLKRLIGDIGEICGAQCTQKGLSFETRYETAVDGSLVGDMHRVQQILMNLLGNAIKFTSKGYVRLAVSQRSAGGERVFVRFEVSDTGCGMSGQMKERLFRPFEQESAVSAQRYGGSGLGLSIVSSLVSMMSGSIRVESVQGEGSIFTVDLPFVKGGAETQSAEQRPAAPAELARYDFTGKRILIAEDNSMNRMLLKRIMERMGIACDMAEDGQIALDKFLASPPGGYDAILMDIQMPNMDGMEASRRIRSSAHPDAARAQIIAVTANAFNEDIAKSLSAGMNAHVSKPIDPQLLAEALKKAFQK